MKRKTDPFKPGQTYNGTTAARFIESLKVPEGKLSGQHIRLAQFQRDFIAGAVDKKTAMACLSVGRGNGKSTLTAGLGLGALLGIWDNQPRREILVAARVRDQASVVFTYVLGLIASLPDELQNQITVRRGAKLEFEFDGGGGHILRCIAAEPKNALDTSPTLAIMDERGHWHDDKGDDLEAALLSGLGKRGGQCYMISTSASSDTHSFSQWFDSPPEGTFVQEHRPEIGLPADDLDSLLIANPGAAQGIGSTIDWLQEQARRAIARGGSSLSSFRLYNRNARVSGERRDMLIDVDTWLDCEVAELPAREGPLIVGVDLGGSSSMSAAVFYWPQTARMESFGCFPSEPGLEDRGTRDGVRGRYVEINQRGELATLGGSIVPADKFLAMIARRADGYPIACLTSDRYRQSEFEEAMRKAGLRVPVVWRGMGWKDGAEDVERFRQAVADEQVKASPSLLMRSALSDAVTISDVSGNAKLAKARSLGRIDPAAAAVLAVAEGRRLLGRTPKDADKPVAVWA
jgi:phage terminase large subunit-like protein